ncbi:hypothetical protein MTP04_05580 [Lysinibacillus sp. PLM2]|nr:hypothetical protein MTP04_05580 [Lysinibacillus sp. PLM2]
MPVARLSGNKKTSRIGYPRRTHKHSIQIVINLKVDVPYAGINQIRFKGLVSIGYNLSWQIPAPPHSSRYELAIPF